MIQQRLEKYMTNRRRTLLGVGPMSKNCVDATIELANEYSVPLMLIASRRQIEAEEFGGGYVNNWSTERFTSYIKENDRRGNIVLARDHGGPWQNPLEVNQQMSLRRAMESSKKSFEVDIECGFDMLHIDPCLDIYGEATIDEILQRVYELYDFCCHLAEKKKRHLIFEVGTDEQSGRMHEVYALEYVIREVYKFCEENKLPKPSFIVAQTGTKVMETRNIGTFDSPFRVDYELPIEIQLPKILDVCRRHGIWLKEHNADYLGDESLEWHPKLGIHAANVAPEFGVEETTSFLNLLEENGLTKLRDQFIELAFTSGKWQKWMLPNSQADARQKAIIAGHYVYATPQFAEIKAAALQQLRKKSIDVDDFLRKKVKTAIFRYMKKFRLLEN